MNIFIIITLCQLLSNTWKISITAPLSIVCFSSQVKGKYVRFWYVMQTWPACQSHAYVKEHLYNGMGTLNFFLKKWPSSDMPLHHYTRSREEYLFDWATGSTGHFFLCLNRNKVESNYLEGSKFNLYWSFVS